MRVWVRNRGLQCSQGKFTPGCLSLQDLVELEIVMHSPSNPAPSRHVYTPEHFSLSTPPSSQGLNDSTFSTLLRFPVHRIPLVMPRSKARPTIAELCWHGYPNAVPRLLLQTHKDFGLQ
jgi:hypothetical protein